MFLNVEKVNRALDCSDKVLAALGLVAADSPFIPVSIEEIQDYVTATGWEIEKEEVVYLQGQYIRGRLHRYPNKKAKIHIRRDQEPDWKRLVAAKELFQILVDEDADLCPYGDEILDALVLEGHIGILGTMEGSKGQTELIAELAAQETLYPLSHREHDLKNGASIGKLALRYGIPEGTVSTMLNPRYIHLVGKAKLLK
jgi:hypothetical protein